MTSTVSLHGAGELIATRDELDALPVNTFFSCGCGHYGTKVSADWYAFASGRQVRVAELASDHLPLVALYQPGASRDDVMARMLAKTLSLSARVNHLESGAGDPIEAIR